MLAAATAVAAGGRAAPLAARVSLAVGAAAGVLVLAWTMTAQLAAASASNSFSRTFLRNLPAPPNWVDAATKRRADPVPRPEDRRLRTGSGCTSSGTDRSSASRASTARRPGPGPTVTPNLLNRYGELAGDPGLRLRPRRTEHRPRREDRSAERAAGGCTGSSAAAARDRPRTGIYSDGWVGSQHRRLIVVSASYNRFETPGRPDRHHARHGLEEGLLRPERAQQGADPGRTACTRAAAERRPRAGDGGASLDRELVRGAGRSGSRRHRRRSTSRSRSTARSSRTSSTPA